MNASISILGELLLHVDGEEVAISSRKQRALLAALAIGRGRPRSADALIADLWGDEPGDTARKNVQVLVGRLRTALTSPTSIQLDRHGYSLPRSMWTFADELFERELDEARQAAAEGAWTGVVEDTDHALARWTGPAFGSLAGVGWARDHARDLDAKRREMQLLRAEALLELHRYGRALTDLRRLTSDDAHDLQGRALLVRALVGAGRQAEALAECRAALASARDREVTVEVDRFRVLERDLLAQENEFASRRGPTFPRVPIPQHPLVGRADERAGLLDQLRSGQRLTTIVGPGGAGKTRLATEVSLALADDVEDVVWIDLSPATSADDVVATLLNAFAITSVEGDPSVALAQVIGARAMCLVLDNFEQVVDSAPIVERMHAACPELLVLATSRIPLGMTSEVVVPLGPFALVADVDQVDVTVLAQLDAVQLFGSRAKLVDGVVPTGEAAVRDMYRICARVDGLPLGIELAAARTRLLTPRDLLDQLDRTFTLLTTRSHEHPERHRSIDGVIAWSHGLLDDEERHAFRVLSLFVGGCDVADFAFVAGYGHEGDARGMLDRLVSYSLAVRAGNRWRMLETIGAFGRRALANDPTEVDVRDRFALRMRAHTDASNTYETARESDHARIVDENANIHAAIDWAVRTRPAVAADIYIGMDRYLHTRGSVFEGDELGVQLQRIVGELDGTRRALVCGLAGRMAQYRGDARRGSDLLGQSLATARATGDSDVLLKVWIWYVEGLRHHGEVDLDVVVSQAEEVRAFAREHDDRWTAALATAQMGFALMDMERAPEALRCYREAKDGFLELGDDFWVENMEANLLALTLIETRDARHLVGLTECAERLAARSYWTYAAHVESFRMRCALELEQFAEAAEWADDLIPRVRRTGEAILLMFALACSSVAYFEQGRTSEARAAAWESLTLAVRSGQTLFADYSLAMLAASLLEVDEVLARWIATAIEIERLDGIYALDRFVLQRLETMFGHLDEQLLRETHGECLAVERLQGVVERATGAAPELVRMNERD